MNTLTYGDVELQYDPDYESLELVIERAKYVELLRLHRDWQAALRKIEHGHQWGYNRQCSCGLTQKTYHLERPTEVCPTSHPAMFTPGLSGDG